ncbi:MAG: class I SAM-dependent methyltransferase [Thermoplasmata archaeon]
MAPAPTEASPATRSFARRLLRLYAEAETVTMIDLGHRTGLWEALAAGPGTAAEIAARAGVDARYAEEWLSAIACARIARYAPEGRRFSLSSARARCLAGPSIYNLAPASRMVTLGARQGARLAHAFRTGRGISPAAYVEEFPAVMEEINRRRYDALLASAYVRCAPGLATALSRGIRVLDVGTGRGYPLLLLARAFPRSWFLGIDPDARSVALARRRAARERLPNLSYAEGTLEDLDPGDRFDAVTLFDVIHDLSRPAQVLGGIARRLRPGGILLATEPRASSDLSQNLGRSGATYLYGISVTYCLPVSRFGGPGGLGACGGEARTRALLAAAGFTRIRTREAPGNALGLVYSARRGLPVPAGEAGR